MELDSISQPELEQIERVGSADLVIGILNGAGQEEGSTAVSVAREALRELSKPPRPPLRTMVVCSNGTHRPDEFEPPEDVSFPVVSSCSFPLPGPAETRQQTISNAYRRVLVVGGKLAARACGVIVSHPQTATREWIYRLVEPVVDLGFDLVAPCYTRQKMEGLLNRGVLSPLHRALYGEHLENPMGPDFGLSGRLLQQVLRQDSARSRGPEHSTLVSIASAAACYDFQICESHLGARSQLPTDWGNLSSLLAEVLGAVFLDMEERAAHWQSVRGSKILPKFGPPETLPADSATIDVHGMIESFHLGTQNLQDVWGLILPPTTLLELRRLARLPEDQFRLPDPLWARIVYDFALGHRLRTISRDHLLRSITPLYLGWIASYVLETQTAGPAEVDQRSERLAKAYEDSKSYLVSRWRWPDRFNP